MKYTKYILFAILVIAALTLVACSEEQEPINNNTQNNSEEEPLLGGDSDEYGCIPSAGYSWCPSLNECVRTWETLCPEYEEYYREPTMCTMEYMPVKGEITVPCAEGECVIVETFGNRCVAESAGAKNIVLAQVELFEVTNFDECVAAGNEVMESFPEQCMHDGQLFVREINLSELDLPENKYEACQAVNGIPLPDFEECEYISQDICEYLGGEFFECESACRNDPDAEFCTMQCVQVCRFN